MSAVISTLRRSGLSNSPRNPTTLTHPQQSSLCGGGSFTRYAYVHVRPIAQHVYTHYTPCGDTLSKLTLKPSKDSHGSLFSITASSHVHCSAISFLLLSSDEQAQHFCIHCAKLVFVALTTLQEIESPATLLDRVVNEIAQQYNTWSQVSIGT